MLDTHPESCGLFVHNHNGTDYVAYSLYGSTASCKWANDSKIYFQLPDGRVASRDGDWLRWTHPHEGYSYEMEVHPADGSSDGKQYVKIGGSWVKCSVWDSYLAFSGRYLVIG